MIFLKIAAVVLAVILLILALILVLPAKINLRYVKELEVFVRVGKIKIRIYPGKEKKKKKKKTAAKKSESSPKSRSSSDNGGQEKKAPPPHEGAKKKKSLSDQLSFILDAVKKVMELLGNKGTVNVDRLTVTVAKENAAETAIQFGICCGIVSSALAFCSNFKNCRIDDDNVGVYPDFVSGQSEIQADISIGARVYSILACGIRILLSYL